MTANALDSGSEKEDFRRAGIFGNPTRTNILLILSLMGESHLSELAEILGTTPSNVQKAVDGLERSGAISGVYIGRARRVSLNPRYFARDELAALLRKLALANKELIEATTKVRRRPRRAGKAL